MTAHVSCCPFLLPSWVGDDAHEIDLRRQYQQIGLKIAYYRKLRGLTQEQLAERLELSPAFIGHVEAPNINKAVSLDTLFDVAAALDVPPYKFRLFDE